jgi:DNA-binding SARP family transcriptional activator
MSSSVPEDAMTAPPQEQRAFALHLLGGFALHREGRSVTAAPAVQRLVAYVATRTKTVNRVATARALWPDSSDARAAANLRSTLWRFRQDHCGGPIRSTAHGLELHPDTIVDVHAVHEQTTALSSVPDRVWDLDPAVLRHDVLPDWTDDWLVPTREWFRQIRLHALETLCARHCRYGRFDAALEAGMAAIDCEPLRESAHRAIVRVHLAEGNPAEALRQYELYRRLVDSELGLRPSQQFRALISHLLGRPLDAHPR